MGTMMNSPHLSLQENQGNISDFITHVHNPNAIRATVIADEFFEKKEQAWFVTSKVPTDLSIQVGDITFYAHKHPLVSKSGYMNRLNLHKASKLNFGNDVKINNFPGGPETFEIILKFCYGLPIDLTPTNVTPLRCASEFLEMTEEFEDGNLISKTESFLKFIVLSSWKNSITVLKSCESLSPWAENLQFISRCCDSIAWQVSKDNLVNEGNARWWFDEVSTLRIDHFVRIITAIRAKGAKPEVIGDCVTHYAEKWLCGMDLELENHSRQGSGRQELHLSILSGKRQEGSIGYNKEQRVLIESLISILPPERKAVSCKFLLRMLKMATVYSATPALVSELEKRIGMVLEDANVNELLIPNYRGGDEEKHSYSPYGEITMYDIDSVQRIVEYFLMREQQRQQQNFGNSQVSKLLDNFLAEIATDPNLTISKFQVLAEALPPSARICNDGLYRAIDTYLKNHPSITEHGRRRLCKLMECDKLSLDACMHAAQNDRLPLRTIIQVLFSEQLKMREAIQKKEPVPEEIIEQEHRWSSAEKAIETTKAELAMVKTMLEELKRDYSELQQEFERFSIKQKNTSWIYGWRKLKNSTFLNEKMVNEETGDVNQRQPSNAGKVSRQRRLSIS
ncbi:hypothetical protein NE237_028850 [Protea cynaroides]|uniref:Uncharacterized protein n=1 Tax=Protea cynaroides TaxID=273540 RepID=A0A9Q0GQR3_9MAGN|nr:hypothetical protein NE237_028850 [Protea cynaroides]